MDVEYSVIFGEPDLYTLVAVLGGVMKHCLKDYAQQQKCHDAALLCTAVGREWVGDGTFINDMVNNTILEGADDVYNLAGISYLTKDLPQAPPPHRVKGLC